MIMYTPGHY